MAADFADLRSITRVDLNAPETYKLTEAGRAAVSGLRASPSQARRSPHMPAASPRNRRSVSTSGTDVVAQGDQ